MADNIEKTNQELKQLRDNLASMTDELKSYAKAIGGYDIYSQQLIGNPRPIFELNSEILSLLENIQKVDKALGTVGAGSNLSNLSAQVKAINTVLSNKRSSYTGALDQIAGISLDEITGKIEGSAKDLLNKRVNFLKYGGSSKERTDEEIEKIINEMPIAEIKKQLLNLNRNYNEIEALNRKLSLYRQDVVLKENIAGEAYTTYVDRDRSQLAQGFQLTDLEKQKLLSKYSDISNPDEYKAEYDINYRQHTLDEFVKSLSVAIPSSEAELEELYESDRKNRLDTIRDLIKDAQNRIIKSREQIKETWGDRSIAELSDDEKKKIKYLEDSIDQFNDSITKYEKEISDEKLTLSLKEREAEIERNVKSLKSTGYVTGSAEIHQKIIDTISQAENTKDIYDWANDLLSRLKESNIDTSNIKTIDQLKELEKTLNSRMAAELGISESEFTVGPQNKSIDPLAKIADEFGVTADELKADSERLKSAINKEIETIQEGIITKAENNKAIDESTQSIKDETLNLNTNNRDYKQEIKDRLSTTGFSKESIDKVESGYLTDIEYIDRYNKKLEQQVNLLDQINRLSNKSNIESSRSPQITLGNDPLSLNTLNTYKNSISSIFKELDKDKEEYTKYFKSVLTGDIGGLNRPVLPDINKYLNILNSPYLSNITQGSVEFDQLQKIRDTLEWINKNSKSENIRILSNDDIVNSEKLLDTTRLITQEQERLARVAEVRENKEKFIADYIKQTTKELDNQYSIGIFRQIQANYKAPSDIKGNLTDIKDPYIVLERAIRALTKDDLFQDSKMSAAERLREAGIELPDIKSNRVFNRDLKLSQFTYEQLTPEQIEKYDSAVNNVLDKFYNDLEVKRKSIEKEIDKLKETIDKLNKLGVDKNSELYKTVEESLKSSQERFSKLNTESYNLGAYDTLASEVKSKFESTKPLVNDYLESIKAKYKEIKSYFEKESLLNNKEYTSAEKIEYYKQQLEQLPKASEEYLGVLRMIRQEESKQAAEEEKLLKAAQNRLNSIGSTIQGFARIVSNTINKIISLIRSALDMVNRTIKTFGTVFNFIKSGISNILTLFGNFGNRIRESFGIANSQTNILNGSFVLLKNSATELRSKLLLIKGALDSLFNNQMVASAKNLMASIYSMKNIMGPELTQSVLDWANSMERAFGLSARELIGDVNELTGVLYGLGMTAQDVAVGSENILMMSRYLAFMGAAGGDVAQVMSKLNSGMKGLSQSIDDLGLSVREAEMNQFLKELKKQGGEFANIGTDFSKLNEEARVYVRYASLISQFSTKYDLLTFADALKTTTGRLSILNQTWKNFYTVVGQGLAVIGSMLTQYIIPILRMAQRVVENLFMRIASFFGFAGEMAQGLGLNIYTNGDQAIDDINKALQETNSQLEDVEDNSKKANGALQSFDRINNMTTKDASDSISDDFDYSKLMGTILGDLNAYAEASNGFFEEMENNFKAKLDDMKDQFGKFIKDVSGRESLDIGFDFPKIKENLSTALENTVETVKNVGDIAFDLGFKIAQDMQLGAIITKITELIAKITELAAVFTEKLKPALDKIYDKYFKEFFENLGIDILDSIDWLIDRINEMIDALNGEIDLETAIKWEGTPWLDFLYSLTDLERTIENIIFRISQLWSALKGEETEANLNEQNDLWRTTLDIITSVSQILQEVLGIVADLLVDFGKFLVSDGLPWLAEQLRLIRDFISDHTDEIKELIRILASFAWESFQLIIEAIRKVVEWLVENTDKVRTLCDVLLTLLHLVLDSPIDTLKILIGLKIGAWLLDIVGGAVKLIALIPQLKSGFEVLKNLLGLGETGGLLKAGLSGLGGGSVLSGGLLAGGLLAGGAGVFGGWSDLFESTNSELSSRDQLIKSVEGTTKLGTVGAGMGLGAMIGSLVPVIGTAIGAAVGAGIGGIVSFFEDEATAEFIVDVAVPKIKEGIDQIKQVFIDLGNTISQKVTDLYNEVKDNIIPNIQDGTNQIISKIKDEIVPGLIENLGNIKDKFVEFINNVKLIKEAANQKIIEFIENNTGNLIPTLKESIENIKSKFNEFKSSVEEVKNNIASKIAEIILNNTGDLIPKIKEYGNSVISKFKELGSSVKDYFSGIKEKAQELINNAKQGLQDIWNNTTDWFSNNKVSQGVESIIDNLKENLSAKKGQKITSHAVGGSILGGQLFIANENGVPELIGNIDGTPKTNVANNEMIIEAMTSGVFTGTYNALAEILSQRNLGGNAGNQTIKIDGFGIIDQSTLRKLAMLLAPFQNSNNINLADTSFSI